MKNDANVCVQLVTRRFNSYYVFPLSCFLFPLKTRNDNSVNIVHSLYPGAIIDCNRLSCLFLFLFGSIHVIIDSLESASLSNNEDEISIRNMYMLAFYSPPLIYFGVVTCRIRFPPPFFSLYHSHLCI